MCVQFNIHKSGNQIDTSKLIWLMTQQVMTTFSISIMSDIKFLIFAMK